MYSVIKPVYGCVVDFDLLKHISEEGEKIYADQPLSESQQEKLEDMGFEIYYYEGTAPQGYLGVQLSEAQPCFEPLAIDDVPDPTPEQFKKVNDLFQQLPEDVKEVAGPPRLHIIGDRY